MASCQQGSRANKGHAGLNQLKVMSSIEACRTEALGGHVAACTKCNHQHIAYNSCKNRHCPKCQGPAARDWTAARSEDLLPVEYFHVAFTLPAEIARIAHWNKKAVYGLLFRASAKTVATIAAGPQRLGARVGMTSVLHTSRQRRVFDTPGSAHAHHLLPSRAGLHAREGSRPHDRAGVEAYHPTAPVGSHVSWVSSCMCGFCLGSSAASLSKG
jgi:hypothetical protein